MPISQVLLMLGGVAVIWAVMRFVIAPKTGSPSIGGMFKREAALPAIGMGREAIKTLVDDASAFVAIELSLRGLVLAGPFASKLGLPSSVISLVFFTDDLSQYQDREWLGRWGYPAKDHRVEDYHRTDGENHIIHHLGLRGAPPVMAWFVEIPTHVAAPPDTLRPALIEGMSIISDPTGQVSTIIRNWRGATNENS
jgi:hypothetical protein